MHNPFSAYSDTQIMHNPGLCKIRATYPLLCGQVCRHSFARVEMKVHNIFDGLLHEEWGVGNIFPGLLGPLEHCNPYVVAMQCNFKHVLKHIPYCQYICGVDHTAVSLEGPDVVLGVHFASHLVATAVLVVTPPPCLVAPAMLGANSCTPAMKLRPIFDVILPTNCRLPGPPPL